MTVPVIDGVDHKTFEYRPVYQEGHLYRGIFEWGMLYKENELPRRESKTRAHDSMPYRCDFYFCVQFCYLAYYLYFFLISFVYDLQITYARRWLIRDKSTILFITGWI